MFRKTFLIGSFLRGTNVPAVTISFTNGRFELAGGPPSRRVLPWKFMKSRLWITALLGVALLAGPVQAATITINFDSLASGTVVSNQYSGVVFSSDGGPGILMAIQDLADQNSQPNVLCATTSPGCNNDVILTFSTPINTISFDAYENQTPLAQAFATAAIFQNNSGTSSLTLNLLVTHTTHCGAPSNDCASDPQTLAFANMTKIVLTPTASEGGANGGTFYDNFSFTQAAVVAPEPSTLLLTGLCGIASFGRSVVRKKRRTQLRK